VARLDLGSRFMGGMMRLFIPPRKYGHDLNDDGR